MIPGQTVAMTRRRRAKPDLRSTVVPVVIAVLALAACSDGGDTVTGAPDETTTTVPEDTTTTVAAPPTTVSPTTDDPAPTSEPAVTSTTTTVPETTTTVPATTTLPPLAALQLRDDGLGELRFGDDPDQVIAAVAAVLGSPTDDTGWVSSDAVALCPGEEFRSVEWGVLRLSFGDVSSFAVDRRHFNAWDYGIEGQLGEEPTGLLSVGGVGLGTRVDELRAAYPEVQVFDGEEGLFPPAYYVNDTFDGFLTGTTDADVVTVMFGGQRCGG